MTEKVKAIAALNAGSHLDTTTITRRTLNPDDVQFDILYCGICHSDLHQARNDWGFSEYPMVPGHEIIGKVIEIGNAITTIPNNFAIHKSLIL